MFDLSSLKAIAGIYGGALPAAFLMAATFSIFGIFVVLKRMVFIGVTLSEVAAFGVAFALVYELPPFAGAALLCLLVVAILAYPYEFTRLPRDTILGAIFIFASGMSILLVAHSGFGLEKVKAILYGNLLFASNADLITICAVMLPALLVLWLFYRPILYSFLDRESAITLGIKAWRYELLFFVFLGLTVAAASRIAGVMLVFCYLVVPAATALLLARHLLQGMLLAVLSASFATIMGIATSYQADLPPNQLIAVISCVFLLLAFLYRQLRNYLSRKLSAGITIIALACIACFIASLNAPQIAVAPTAVSTEIITNTATKEANSNLTLSGTNNATPDWATLTESFEAKMAVDPENAQMIAIELLLKDPPPFFGETIIMALEKHLKQKLFWDFSLPAAAPQNQKTVDLLRKKP
ncbi:MAG: metal ABC transporter permease [Candidatus Riflebacteria bacterium]|nr:metal ABC transporter permease [Candidatus Riflebacteria bacterium]